MINEKLISTYFSFSYHVFLRLLYGFKQAIARRIRYLLPCSRRHIHFFQSLITKKSSQNRGIHDRFLKE
jgi:hypothetical protein